MRLRGRRNLRRGVLILPSLFTLGNLFCGFVALMEATRGRFQGSTAEVSAEHFARAALFIALAMVLDGLDGKVARLAHATSPLGIQLDSLADVVSFGVAPAVLAYSWALVELPRFGWAAAFVFMSCGALRLARFNVQASAHPDHRYFVGLPIPGGAGAVAALVYAWPAPVADRVLVALVAVWVVLLALLMVSTIRYRSFKQIDVTRRYPVRVLVTVVFLIALVRAFPEASLVAAVFLYVLHGPLVRLWGLARRRGEGVSEPAGAAGAGERHP